MKCPKCGSEVFYGNQAIRGTITVVCKIVDGKGIFVRNPSPDGSMDTSGLTGGDPEGPFMCIKCGMEVTCGYVRQMASPDDPDWPENQGS